MKQFSGWSGYWAEFLQVNKQKFIEQLSNYCREFDWVKTVSEQQIMAWHHEFDVMHKTLKSLSENIEASFLNKAWISFEHELFGESGKRAADVNLVLPSGELFMIEFKHKQRASPEEITRAGFDLSTLLKFHSESINLQGKAYLVLSREDAQPFFDDFIVSDIAQNQILHKLKDDLLASIAKDKKYDVSKWQEGVFYRQPGILSGTVDLFYHHKMPNLKNEAAENLNEARDGLIRLYEHARDKKKRYVVMVNGRPGAGKTLLGMTVVTELARQYKDEGLAPLFISGNDPLVEVLRYTLDYYGKQQNKHAEIDGASVIEKLINFKRQFKLNARGNAAQENYIFFDEAQRAWDHIGQHENESESELHLLCRWLKQKEFGVLVLLIGDGQAIHNKEMSMAEFMTKFNDAIAKHGQDFHVIMPQLHSYYCAGYIPSIKEIFNLKTPIRQHYTDKLDLWVEAVLDGDAVLAYEYSKLLESYPLYITQSKEAAESYACKLKSELHENEQHPTKFRMGWLESSRGNSFGQSFLKQIEKGKGQIGPWYVHQPEDPQSCCALNSSSTEFVCQGLEISLALFHWGNDLLYRDARLQPQPNKRVKDEYTFGAYRVLLSRGKNGLILHVEDQVTYEFLSRCGVKTFEDLSF